MATADLKRAIDYLSARCDYAREDDGVGFNSSDTVYGHELAATPFEAWTEDDRIAVRVMLQKYGGQLDAIDIVPAALPREGVVERLTAEERIARERQAIDRSRTARTKARAAAKAADLRIQKAAAKHKITIEGSEFVIAFPYHRQMVLDVKAIPGRKRFDGGRLAWRLRIDDVEPQRLLDFLDRYAFAKPADVHEKIVEIIAHPRPKLSTTSATPAAARTVEVADGGTAIEVTFPYDAAIVETFKAAVPAARFAKEPAPRWLVPMRPASVEGLARFLADHPRFGFQVSATVSRVIADMLDQARAALDASKAVDADEAFVARYLAAVPPELRDEYRILPDGSRRYGFQIAGVAYALDKQRIIFGDEPGLGKTIQAIMSCVLGDAWPVVAVVPAGLVYNWYREFKRWAPRKTVSILTNDRFGVGYAADVLIINYDILTQRAAKGEKRDRASKEIPFSRHALGIMAANPKAIIFDEVHLLKNHRALRTRASAAMAKGCVWRFGLSGTFFLNRPSEGIAPLSVLGRLGDLGGFHYYTRRYCNAHDERVGRGRTVTDFSGASHLNELNTKLRATCYVRREKSDVLKDLPPKTWTPIEFEIDNRAEYNRIEADVAAWFGQKAARSEAFLATLDVDLAAFARRLTIDEDAYAAAAGAAPGNRADVIAAIVAVEREARIERFEASATDRASKVEQLIRIEALKQAAVRGKLAAMKAWIADFAGDQKLVTFATHIDVQHQLAGVVPGAAHIFSADSKEERDRAVARFQDDQRCRLLVASLDRKMAVGYTVTAASNVAFAELAWTPGDMDQAIDRTHRIGQACAVTGWLLLARNTIETEIVALLDAKRAVVEAANIGGKTIERVSILTELAARLAKRTPATTDALTF